MFDEDFAAYWSAALAGNTSKAARLLVLSFCAERRLLLANHETGGSILSFDLPEKSKTLGPQAMILMCFTFTSQNLFLHEQEQVSPMPFAV